MRIQIISDIHINHWRGSYKDFLDSIQTDADVLVIAGDAFDIRDEIETRERLVAVCARYPHVVYVPGNHEYYTIKISEGNDRLHRLANIVNLTVLDAGVELVMGGKTFIGATMWQPAPDPDEYTQEITDHMIIPAFSREAPQQFEEFRAFLETTLGPQHIVVTHHTPSYKSCALQFMGSPANRWFHTPEVEPLILERKPAMWIHGHTHAPFDYKLGKTRMICNPRGYPGEGVAFNPKLVVEI